MQKKLLYPSIFLFLINYAAIAQKLSIAGKYLLVKIEEKGQTTLHSQIVEFKTDGNFLVQDIPIGTWKLKANAIIFDANKIKGAYKISHTKKGLLVLKNNSSSLFFKKLNYSKIIEDNIKSGLIGTWQRFDTIDGIPLQQIIKFEKPDKFKLVVLDEGSISTASGVWFLFPQKKQLLLFGLFEDLRGTNSNLSYNNGSLYFENHQKTFRFKKIKIKSIQHLNFSEADFYDANGAYKYESDVEKLPWKTPYQYHNYLKNIKKIQYRFSKYIPESQTFETKILTSKVNTTEEHFHIDYIFDGYDRYHLPDDTALKPNNYDSYKNLYPYNLDTFRVKGNEKISVPAGSFVCTVVEATAGMDDRIKLWLINDKPGVFAKIIIETPGKWGKYWEFILLKIIK